MDKNAFKKKGKEDEEVKNEIKDVLNNWYLGEEGSENKEEPQLDDPRIIRQGYLKTTMPEEGDKPCKLAQKWFCLTEGSLYLYKDQFGEKHTNWLKLRGSKISIAEKDGKQIFDVESGDKTFSFHADDEDDQNRWVMYLKAELNSNPSQPPKRLVAKKKGKMFSASKNFYEKAALTQPGKKLILSFAPEEMVDVLEKLSNLFQKISKRGDEHYSNALRVIMKSLLLIKGKEASIEDFRSCRIPGLKAWHSFIEMENSKNKKKRH